MEQKRGLSIYCFNCGHENEAASGAFQNLLLERNWQFSIPAAKEGKAGVSLASLQNKEKMNYNSTTLEMYGPMRK